MRRARVEHHRISAGEPADGAGEIDVVEQLLAAVAFELDEQGAVAGGARRGQDKRREEEVFDLRAIRRRRLLQQRARQLGPQHRGHAADDAGVVRAAVSVDRQRRRRHVQRNDLAPPLGLGAQRVALRVCGQLLRPSAIRRRLRRKGDFLAARELLVGALQVIEDHPPRDGVDDKVVRREQQTAGPRARAVEQRHPEHRAVGEAHARL